MTRALGRWVGIALVSAAILFIPIFTGAQGAADATAEARFWLAFGSSVPMHHVRVEDRNCEDFASRAQAQRFFIAQGGPEKDAHRLDSGRPGRGDGKACTGFDY
jgi:hypothetical protein